MSERERMEQRPGVAGFSCLMLEDDAAFATLVAQVVREAGGDPVHCGTIAAARAMAESRTFDLVLLDNHLPDGKAYDFFDWVSRRQPEAPIVMITGLPDLTEAITLTRNGLFDYLTKPIGADVLSATLERAKLRLRRAASAAGAGGAGAGAAAGRELRGDAPAVRAVRQQLQQAARHGGATVLLTGESGTGKDVAARALHGMTFGERAASAPFVAVNCAAVPAEMFEAELFGAERGAYTGADKKRAGLVASAQGGTLFLDEIAEVPLPLQAKLLRFLEAREFRPLGGVETVPFTGRFVAATNKSLRAEVQAGRFREDLYYRIEVHTIELPPLRQRREDIPALAEHLLGLLAARYERPTPNLRAADLAALQAYDFPGNVRELRNVLERALLRTPDDQRWLALDLSWLRGLAGGTPAPASAAAPVAPTSASSAPPLAASPAPAPAAAAAAFAGGSGAASGAGLDEPLPPERAGLTPIEAQEYRLIRTELRGAQGGIRRAAAKLGLSPQALLRRLEKWPELRRDS